MSGTEPYSVGDSLLHSDNSRMTPVNPPWSVAFHGSDDSLLHVWQLPLYRTSLQMVHGSPGEFIFYFFLLVCVMEVLPSTQQCFSNVSTSDVTLSYSCLEY